LILVILKIVELTITVEEVSSAEKIPSVMIPKKKIPNPLASVSPPEPSDETVLELLDYMFIDFHNQFTTKLLQTIQRYKMEQTHLLAFLNFLAGAFITMIDSPVASRHGFVDGYMSSFTEDSPLMFGAVVQHPETQVKEFKLFYFSYFFPETKDNFFLHPETMGTLVSAVDLDHPDLVNKLRNTVPENPYSIQMMALVSPTTMETREMPYSMAHLTSVIITGTAVASFHKLQKSDIDTTDLNAIDPKNPILPHEGLERKLFLKLQENLEQLQTRFSLDTHDDGTYRFYTGALNNWANRLQLHVDVWMEDYYSIVHAAIRHLTINFQIFPGKLMKLFGIPLLMLIRHPDRPIPDYETLGAFSRSLGPDAPYQITTESGIYRLFEIQMDGNGLTAGHTLTARRFVPGKEPDMTFAQRMIDSYPVDQHRLVLIEARKALMRQSHIDNVVAHFFGLLMTNDADAKNFYVLIENAPKSLGELHLFLIRGYDPSALIVVCESRVNYKMLIKLLIEHCTKLDLPSQFTLNVIEKATDHPASFRQVLGDHFIVSTPRKWFDWSTEAAVYSEVLNDLSDLADEVYLIKQNSEHHLSGHKSPDMLEIDEGKKDDILCQLKESAQSRPSDTVGETSHDFENNNDENNPSVSYQRGIWKNLQQVKTSTARSEQVKIPQKIVRDKNENMDPTYDQQPSRGSPIALPTASSDFEYPPGQPSPSHSWRSKASSSSSRKIEMPTPNTANTIDASKNPGSRASTFIGPKSINQHLQRSESKQVMADKSQNQPRRHSLQPLLQENQEGHRKSLETLVPEMRASGKLLSGTSSKLSIEGLIKKNLDELSNPQPSTSSFGMKISLSFGKISRVVSESPSPKWDDDPWDLLSTRFSPFSSKVDGNFFSFDREVLASYGLSTSDSSDAVDDDFRSAFSEDDLDVHIQEIEDEIRRFHLMNIKQQRAEKHLEIFNSMNIRPKAPASPKKDVPLRRQKSDLGPVRFAAKRRAIQDVNLRMFELPDISNLLSSRYLLHDQVFAGMTKCEHILFIVGSFAENIVGLKNAVQITTLISAAMSKMANVKLHNDPGNQDPTILGLEDLDEVPRRVFWLKFVLEKPTTGDEKMVEVEDGSAQFQQDETHRLAKFIVEPDDKLRFAYC